MSTQSSQKDTKDCKDASHDSRLKRMNKSYLDSYKDSKSLAQIKNNLLRTYSKYTDEKYQESCIFA